MRELKTNVGVFCVALLAMSAAAPTSSRAKNLGGTSVEITYFTQTTFKKEGEPIKTTRPEQRVLRFYISTKGRIFQYSSVWSDKYSSLHVVPIGRAVMTSGTQMLAFAITGNKVTRLVKQVRGLEEQTIDVSLATGTCDLSITSHPDSSGQIASIDPVSGRQYEQLSRVLLSYSCRVTSGNTFGQDE